MAAAHEGAGVTPTWDSTLGALDAATLPLDWAGTLVSHLDSVCASEALQSAYAAVRPEIGAFYADIPLHEGLYSAIHGGVRVEDMVAVTATGHENFNQLHSGLDWK